MGTDGNNKRHKVCIPFLQYCYNHQRPRPISRYEQAAIVYRKIGL